MTEEKKTEGAVDLFIQHQRDINDIKEDVTELIKQDLGLGHKMDMLMTEQRLLKERVEEGVSKTASKTYEMVNQIFSQMKDLGGENKIRDIRIKNVERINEWIVRGFIIATAAGMLGALIFALIKWKL